MANETKSDFSELAEAIAKASRGDQRQYVPFGKQKISTPFNPSGNRKRKLTRPIFQNGAALNVKFLHDEEISLLEEMTTAKVKPGRYLDREVAIVALEDDISGAPGALDIRYKNKDRDQHMAILGKVGGFANLLRMVIAEHKQNEINAKAALKAAVA